MKDQYVIVDRDKESEGPYYLSDDATLNDITYSSFYYETPPKEITIPKTFDTKKEAMEYKREAKHQSDAYWNRHEIDMKILGEKKHIWKIETVKEFNRRNGDIPWEEA